MNQPLISKEEKQSVPFEIKKAVIGIELGATDFTILNYIDFLSRKIPFESLYFINVIKEVELLNAFYENNIQALSSRQSMDESLIQQMELKVKGVLTKEKEIITDYVIREGDPLTELLASVETTGAELLIIGQRRGDDYHGILTKNLVRQSKVDTLVIPENSNATISNILVPIDFSEYSARALKKAVSMASRFSGSVHISCLNVFEMPNISFYHVDKSYERFSQMIQGNIKDAFEAFIHTHAREYKDQISIHLVEKEMPGTGKYVYSFATENNCDLIVMGLKGHSNLHLLLMGSTTEKMLSINKKIPTLLIK